MTNLCLRYRNQPGNGFDGSVCNSCKKPFDGYVRPSGTSQTSLDEINDEMVATVTFRDNQKNSISSPIAIKINKKGKEAIQLKSN